MTAEPYASAERVFWVVDNGSSHRGQASIRRLEGNYDNLHLIHLPVHASWLNQIEIYFSIVQRKVLSPNDFIDLGEVEQRLLGFQRRYGQTRSRSPGAIHGLTWIGSSAAWANQPSPSKPRDHRASGPSRPDGSRRRSRRSDLEEAVERRRRVPGGRAGR